MEKTMEQLQYPVGNFAMPKDVSVEGAEEAKEAEEAEGNKYESNKIKMLL